jgi:5'-nucleotidase
MLVFLTNDDGIYASGLRRLKVELEKIADVYVIAPDRERSASSHSVTMHKPLRVQPVNFEKAQANSWAASGTPADCVKLALEIFLDHPPDLLVSGINRGANLGTDVFYCGTVSAAIEGLIHGIPSLAISVTAVEDEKVNYRYAADFAKRLCQKIFCNRLPFDTLLNVNIPNLPENEIKGVKITKLGWRRYVNAVHERQDPRGRKYYWLAGSVADINPEPNSDITAIADSMVSITPVFFDLTNHRVIEQVKGWFETLSQEPAKP